MEGARAMSDQLGDHIGYRRGQHKPGVRATNARAAAIAAWVLLAALTLTALVGIVCVAGCALHIHVWGAYYKSMDAPTTQGAGQVSTTQPGSAPGTFLEIHDD